jgi:hypothetical protein
MKTDKNTQMTVEDKKAVEAVKISYRFRKNIENTKGIFSF